MKLTPYDIVTQGNSYSIPIYQRLFEWDKENITNLLDDLKKSYERTNGNSDYYIGMLTATEGRELVDGQQRFTVMMLLGCVLQQQMFSPEWKDFLISNGGTPRLYFSSRPKDNEDLKKLIEFDGASTSKDLDKVVLNKKMKNGFKVISDYFNDVKKIPEDQRRDFARYIFYHLCFFISTLPKGYSPRELNKYFERMNTSGKNLELHEILKVKLLSNIQGDITAYLTLWNKLADTDTLLIRRRKNENDGILADRKRIALNSNIETIISNGLFNGLGVKKKNDNIPINSVSNEWGTDEENDRVTIASVPSSSEEPKSERESNKSSRCALTFPYLLLHTLYRMMDGNIEDSKEDFFRPSNLLDLFKKYLPYEGNEVNPEIIKEFMEQLVKCRLALDVCFIRPTEFGYSLDMNLAEDDEILQKLLMLQSLLYVASSNYTNYKWFGWLMDCIQQSNGIPEASALYQYLKQKDEEDHPLPVYGALSYKEEIRYWFWKLDFHIWLNRKTLLKNTESKNVAENYVFRRNRSIEHIAPQHPESLSDMVWEDSEEDRTLRNSFGNLVMISQGFNSALSNESYEVKKAHVQAYCNGSISGSIESLKMLVAHEQYEKWNKDRIKEHGRQMYEWLKESMG